MISIFQTLIGILQLVLVCLMLVYDCNLTQHVFEPTHVKGNILDFVFTTPSIAIDSLTIHPLSFIGFSDILLLVSTYCVNIPFSVNSVSSYVFDFRKANYEGITSFLLDYDFSCFLNSTDIEFIWCVLKSSICEAMSFFIPKILIKRKPSPK